LASWVSLEATSRTCTTLPAPEGTFSEEIAWIESITSTSGESFSTSSVISSRQAEDMTERAGPFTPRRLALKATCLSDSSPET